MENRWETKVPKEIYSSNKFGDIFELMDTLILEEETYAIRIGKEGLK